ncbi:MAG TPA: hypothetical protein PLQ93_08680 [Bacteroidia bacterium]|nr:hypothetical protein [Bacteroidia bacterium]
MKAIISHDIDHLSVSEHLLRDMIVPKHLVRNHIELFLGKISAPEYLGRWKELGQNKWQNILELIRFNAAHAIPSQFFIAVNKGIGLNYPLAAAGQWIELLRSQHCELGLHGIAYNRPEDIKEEYDRFQALSKLGKFGIRMHYVRQDRNTFRMLEQCGYAFDSTEHAFKNPYQIGEMWEFPIQIMDGWIIENHKGWQDRSLKEAREHTLALIAQARNKNLEYLNIVFHDRYFSSSYRTWMDWYTWLVEYLQEQQIPVLSFKAAVQELESVRVEKH